MKKNERINKLLIIRDSVNNLLREEGYSDTVSPETQEIVRVFERLSPEYRKRVIEVAKLFIGQ